MKNVYLSPDNEGQFATWALVVGLGLAIFVANQSEYVDGEKGPGTVKVDHYGTSPRQPGSASQSDSVRLGDGEYRKVPHLTPSWLRMTYPKEE